MKFVYWVAVVFMALLPLNYLLQVGAKLVHDESFGRENVIGLAVAAFGVVAAVVIYRANLYKPSPKPTAK